jgi:hypothetical protein
LKHPPKYNEVTRLRDALADVIEDEVLDEWLQRPNAQFDGSIRCKSSSAAKLTVSGE